MATASVNSFIPIMAKQRQLSADRMFFVLSALFLLISRLLNKKRVSVVGNIKVFYAGNLIYFIAFAVLAFAQNNIWLLLAASLYGLGAGFIHPTVNTAAVKNCPQPDRGLATGTFMMSQDLGMAVGAFLWGMISDKAGFTAVYIVVCVLVAVMGYVFKKVLSAILE
jgi:MFS family permease